ncbi:LPP20 family lipoprotein [Chitinivorax sp. PXF-14]|uniref:LPP20 family lipoprotein n=1 Tax=Chitinivorax sp. PXF-14 TaxID=3230488 RepID=UPI0034675BEE
MKHTLSATLLALATVLYGCANPPSLFTPAGSSAPAAKLRFTATGYGSASTFEGYTAGQRRLLAMRAAKLDAYRSLAEQVYGVRIKGNTTVAAMVAQNDSFRVYLDAYLRGAHVVSVTPMAEGNYETEIEIELPPDFWRMQLTAPPTASATASSSAPAGATASASPVLASSGYNRSFYYAD